jgi:hypothetical protein
MIIDCFTFFDELDLLEVRLAEMSDAVDLFVLAEAPVTFQGKPKPLVFADNRARFGKYLSRIRHIVVEDMPPGSDPWPREYHQRDALRRGLLDVPEGSTVIVSDVDEIVKPRAIREAVRLNAFCFLSMQLHLYFLDRSCGPWMKAYAAPLRYVREMASMTAPRAGEHRYLVEHGLDPAAHVVTDAGWHFSWMGGVERMLAKLRAFSHMEPEVTRWQDPAALSLAIAENRFFFDGRPLSPVPMRDLPRQVRQHAFRYYNLGRLASRPARLAGLAARLGACRSGSH